MTDAVHRPATPRFGAVLVEQIRTTFMAARLEAAAVVALLAVAAAAAIAARVGASEINEGQPAGMPFFVLVGLLCPFIFWKGEKLHRGAYIWTLPVDHRLHALAKLSAGWMWLMLSIAGFLGWLLAVTVLSGGTVGTQDTRLMLPAGWDEEPISRAALTEVPWTTPWQWIVPFTAGTIAYLFGGAFVLGLKHPLRWGAGLLLTFFASVALSEATGAGWIEAVLSELVMGGYGLQWALSGGVGLSTEITTTERQFLVVWQGYQTAERWLAATAVWMLLGALALWAALRRHREA